MSNPARILSTLDRHLTSPAEITLFGRSALALGFPSAPSHFHNTHDVDGILPLPWLQPPDAHVDFWAAVQKTNDELEPDGLYLTHLFREVDVILRTDWLSKRIPISFQLRQLQIFRPATVDLILTKMARADEDDLNDIAFMIRADKISNNQLQDAFAHARVPRCYGNRRTICWGQPKVLALSAS